MNSIAEINTKEQNINVGMVISQIAQVHNVRVSEVYLQATVKAFNHIKETRHPELTPDMLVDGYARYMENTTFTFMPDIGRIVDALYSEERSDCRAETEHFTELITTSDFGLQGKALCAIFPNEAFAKAFADLNLPTKYLYQERYVDRFAEQYHQHLHHPDYFINKVKLWSIVNQKFMANKPAEAFEKPLFLYVGFKRHNTVQVIEQCRAEYKQWLEEIKEEEKQAAAQEKQEQTQATPAEDTKPFDMWEED